MKLGKSTFFVLPKLKALKLLFVLSSIFLLNSCSEYVTAPQEGNTANKASLYEKQCSEDQCPCSTSLGVIKHGTKIKVYGSPQVSCGQKCEEQTTEVTCKNGKLNPSIEGKFFTCSMAECKSCTIENNLIRHGESAFLFSKANANCSESCIDFKAERKCNDGKLEGDTGFKYSICQNRLCTCDLPEGGTALTLGGKMNFFKVSKAACGTKCSDAIQSRTCVENNGVFSFSGDPAYKKTTCQEASGCECQLPNAQGSVKDGDVLFLTSHLEVACGNECKPEYTVPVKCSNGILLNTKDNSSINILTTPYILKGSCVVKACQNCIVDQTTQTSVSHGTKRKFYKAASPTCGNHCDSKEKTCKDGTFLPADASFVSNTCAERKCSCDVPDQSQVSLGVGLQQPFYKVLKTSGPTNNTPGCGKSCENADVKELKTCTDRKSVV